MRYAGLVCVALLLIATVVAQSHHKNDATFSGTVVDEIGAVIPGARVVFKGHGTRATVTDKEGKFSFNGLRKGWYSLRAEKTNFKDAILKGIEIKSGKSYQLRVRLDAGKIGDWIILTDQPITIDTTSSSPHNCITDSDMQSIPMDRSIGGAISAAGRCP